VKIFSPLSKECVGGDISLETFDLHIIDYILNRLQKPNVCLPPLSRHFLRHFLK